MIDSSTEVEKKLTSMDKALNNHNDNFDVYLKKKYGKFFFLLLCIQEWINSINVIVTYSQGNVKCEFGTFGFYRCAGEETYQFGPKTQKFDTEVQKL